LHERDLVDESSFVLEYLENFVNILAFDISEFIPFVKPLDAL